MRNPGRLRFAGVKWQIVVFLAGAAALVSAVLSRPMLRGQLEARVRQQLEQFELAYQKRDANAALDSAEAAVEHSRKVNNKHLGDCLLASGLAYGLLAESTPVGAQRAHWVRASRYFLEASEEGVSEENRQRLAFHTAKSHYRSGRIQESFHQLHRFVEQNSAYRHAAIELLAEAHLTGDQRELKQSLEWNLLLLTASDTPSDVFARAWERRREILTRLGQEDLIGELYSEKTDRANLIEFLQATQEIASGYHEQATRRLRAMLGGGNLPPDFATRVHYALGRMNQLAGNRIQAAQDLSELIQVEPDSDEAIAAAIRLCELYLGEEKLDTAAAVSVVNCFRFLKGRGLLQRMEPSSLWNHNQVDSCFRRGIARLQKAGNYAAAEEGLFIYSEAVPNRNTYVIAAQLYQDWAQAAQTPDSPEPKQLLRHAATAYLEAAGEAANEQQANALRIKASVILAQLDEFEEAVKVLSNIVAQPKSHPIRPEALALSCKFLAESGNCVEASRLASRFQSDYPNHSLICQVRYHWAYCLWSEQELLHSERLLRLNGAAKTAAARETLEDSQLLLARVLIDQKRLGEAIVQLDDLLVRQTDPARTIETHWLLGQTFRQHADRITEQGATYQVINARDLQQSQRREYLHQALRHYLATERLLSKDAVTNSTTELTDILRDCRWSITETLFEMERYAEAVDASRAIVRDSQAASDWFDAQILQANCFEKLGRKAEADQIVESATLRFQQMTPTDRKAVTIGMNPDRYNDWQTWKR